MLRVAGSAGCFPYGTISVPARSARANSANRRSGSIASAAELPGTTQDPPEAKAVLCWLMTTSSAENHPVVVNAATSRRTDITRTSPDRFRIDRDGAGTATAAGRSARSTDIPLILYHESAVGDLRGRADRCVPEKLRCGVPWRRKVNSSTSLATRILETTRRSAASPALNQWASHPKGAASLARKSSEKTTTSVVSSAN